MIACEGVRKKKTWPKSDKKTEKRLTAAKKTAWRIHENLSWR